MHGFTGKVGERAAADPSRGVSYGPRERLLHLGELRLSDAECLALILRTGQPGVTAEQLAQRLLARFGGLAGLAAATQRQLGAEHGVGPARAAAMLGAFGLARRLVEAGQSPGAAIRGGHDVARIVHESVRASKQESFFALLLDARHRVIGLRVVSRGSLQSAPVHPREVFGPAIRDGAAAMVVAHNHPSGDPTPSDDDRRITDRLRQVGQLIGIEVLDHVVVGDRRFYSFADERFHTLAVARRVGQ